jgi:hypothetical protein
VSVSRKEINELFLNKKLCITLEKGGKSISAAPLNVVASFVRNLETLGFTVSKRLFTRFKAVDASTLATLQDEIVPVLKTMVGAHRRYKPMYPNFPQQVMEASDAELWYNAWLHYATAWVSDSIKVPLRYMPEYEEKERAELKLNEVSLKVIDLGTEESFLEIFTQLAASNGSLSESDKELLKFFVTNYGKKLEKYIPEVVPSKENLAVIGAAVMTSPQTGYLMPARLTARFKTATDVLRLACALSEGDVSLAKPTKFRKFKRYERRELLRVLEQCGSLVEDMLRWQERWKRLAKMLHPFEYKNTHKNCVAAFEQIVGETTFRTYDSQVEEALKAKRLGTPLIDLLKQRPGVFARRLDHALRSASAQKARLIADGFLKVAPQVSTPVLLQIYQHFKNRPSEPWRAFFPKGVVAKVHVLEQALPKLTKGIGEHVSDGVRKVLVKRFKILPPLGKVFIDEALREQLVPFSQRSASKALRTITRGSRMPLPDSKALRFFLWWKEPKGVRTDIDLGASYVSEDWGRTEQIAYYNLRNAGLKACHSGDITSAPNGACEFIDIDVESALEAGYRYVVMAIYSFTGQPYCDLPECFAGWMGRTDVRSGEIFDARTVQDKIDLAADQRSAMPIIFDLKERKAIWADLSMTSDMRSCMTARNTPVTKMAKAIVELNKPNLFDLFEMHAQARGKVVKKRETAETVFSLTEGVTPFEIDTILSEYVANAGQALAKV